LSKFLKSYLGEIYFLAKKNKSQPQDLIIQRLAYLIRQWWYLLNFYPFYNKFVSYSSSPLILKPLPLTPAILPAPYLSELRKPRREGPENGRRRRWERTGIAPRGVTTQTCFLLRAETGKITRDKINWKIVVIRRKNQLNKLRTLKNNKSNKFPWFNILYMFSVCSFFVSFFPQQVSYCALTKNEKLSLFSFHSSQTQELYCPSSLLLPVPSLLGKEKDKLKRKGNVAAPREETNTENDLKACPHPSSVSSLSGKNRVLLKKSRLFPLPCALLPAFSCPCPLGTKKAKEARNKKRIYWVFLLSFHSIFSLPASIIKSKTQLDTSSFFKTWEERNICLRKEFTIKEKLKRSKNFFLAILKRRQTYSDSLLLKILWKWAYQRHVKKSNNWIIKQYFSKINGKNRIFATLISFNKNKKNRLLSSSCHFSQILPVHSFTSQRKKGKKSSKILLPFPSRLVHSLAPHTLPKEEKERTNQERKGEGEDKWRLYLKSKDKREESCYAGRGVLHKTKRKKYTKETKQASPQRGRGLLWKRGSLNKTTGSFNVYPSLKSFFLTEQVTKKAKDRFKLFFTLPNYKEITTINEKKRKKKYAAKKLSDLADDVLYWSYKTVMPTPFPYLLGKKKLLT